MMQNAIGNATYNKGLRYYLQTSEHQSVGSDELYAGIQASINEDFTPPYRLDFATIMRSWEFQVKAHLTISPFRATILFFSQDTQ